MKFILKKIPYEKIDVIPRYQRWLIFLGIIVFFVVLFYFLMYKGRAEQLKRLETRLSKLQEEIRINKIKEKKLSELRVRIKKLNRRLTRARTQLPESKEIPELLTYISKLGTQEGLDFLLFKPLEEFPRDFYQEIPVEIKIAGDYHGVIEFFDRIGSLNRIVNIDEIKMGNAKMEEETNVITTTCVVTTFMFRETGIEGETPKKRHINTVLGFSLFYPAEWTLDESGALGTVLMIKDTKSPAVFTPVINVMVRYIQSPNLTGYIESNKRQLKSIFADYKIESEGRTFINELPAYHLLASYTQGGKLLKSRSSYIVKGQRIYIISTVALRDDYLQYADTFDEVTSSFLLQKKAGLIKIGVLPLSTYDPTDKRDPFRTLIIEEEEVPLEEIIREARPPLEMYDLAQMKLVGIFWGELGRYGLIELPDSKEYMVRVDTALGKRKGKVIEIMDNSIIVEEEKKYRRGGRITSKIERVVLKFIPKEG